jgi:pimeloyl-ACP methyl ester carboxylesterase
MNGNNHMSTEIKNTFVDVNGIRLHIAQAGPPDGTLVLLAHGFPEFWYGWRKQIPYLAKAGYHVIAPDQRGYNLSDKPQSVQDYQIDKLANDLIALAKSQGKEKFHLVGHDWGAAVAWWTGVHYPEHLKSLSILNVPHLMVMRKNLLSNIKQIKKSWYAFAFQLPFFPEWFMGHQNFRKSIGALKHTSQPGSFSDDDLEKYREAWAQPGAMQAMINWYRAIGRRPPKMANRGRVSTPTQILWGAKDEFLGQEMVEPSIAFCDRGKVEIYPEATHWLQHDDADAVNTALLTFMQEHDDLGQDAPN